MALSENEVTGENVKTAPSTDTSKSASNDKKEKPLTKIIIRRLPPSINENDFIEQISPVSDYDYLYLVKGDMSLGENAFSRVYINFVHAKDVFIFKEKFDNYVFVDGKGHEYPAVVEFAAFQKIPKRRSKFRVDPKCNSIETDPMYLEFLESLKDQPAEEEKPEFSYQPSTDSKKDMTTPLLEYIKQRKMDKQRIREEKREERKKREIERKKVREEDRRKRRNETSPAVSKSFKEPKEVPIKLPQTLEVKEKEEPSAKPEKTEKTDFKVPEKVYKKYEDRKVTTKVKPKVNVRNEKVFDKKVEYKKKEDPRPTKYERDMKKESTSEGQKPVVKKVKKYSERREERKIEAQKAELKKSDVTGEKPIEKPSSSNAKKEEIVHEKTEKVDNKECKEEHDNNEEESSGNRIYNSEPSLFQEKLPRAENSLKIERRKSMDESKSDGLTKENELKMQRQTSLSEEMSEDYCGKQDGSGGSKRNKENDPRSQRRIRNKDRPTMQIYKPGMLSRRRQSDNSEDSKN